MWRYWAKALGEKATKNDREADHIAHIRTVIFFTYLVTNIFIVAGVVRHWNDGETIHLHYYEIPGNLHQEQEKESIQTSCNIL